VALSTVILDTNILVASGFKPNSRSAQLVGKVRYGLLRMVWTEQTRHEAEFIIRTIPPLSWNAIAELFRPEDCYTGDLFPERFNYIPDKDDIKFAALSDATGAALITTDRGLLDIRQTLKVPILRPSEFMMWRDLR
jgi:predicted nucleic acid-binding protein